MSEEIEKENREKEQNHLPVALGPGPAGPAHLEGGTCDFFPSRQASRSPASAVSTPGSYLPAPCPFPRLETSGRRPAPFPSLQRSFPLLPRRVRLRQKNPPEQADALAWPSTSRSPSELSPVSSVERFVELQKMTTLEPT